MTFVESIKAVLTNYAGFTGRASRSEFWWFYLFTVLVSLVFNVLSGGNAGSFFGIVSALVSLALLLPSLAVGVRRLHDIGRSGWYLLFALIPLAGIIILIVWWARAGDVSDNAFGATKTGATAA
ncbi:MAG: uncharacterized membrane protein YhaH (DUF805 family) [Alpinimonas sp.]|jgi:uncharacterized membrane protein YhaH (DUF805 family)